MQLETREKEAREELWEVTKSGEPAMLPESVFLDSPGSPPFILSALKEGLEVTEQLALPLRSHLVFEGTTSDKGVYRATLLLQLSEMGQSFAVIVS